MKSMIIYGSKYGTSKKYALKLSEKLDIPAVSYKEAEDINNYDSIIYIGGLYAGGVRGMAKTLRKWTAAENKKLCIITVGLSDPKEEKNITNIRKVMKTQLPEELYNMASIYHLRGGIDYSGLNAAHRLMMSMLYKKAKNIPPEQQDAETKAMIETYNQKVDFVNFEELEPIVEYLKEKNNL